MLLMCPFSTKQRYIQTRFEYEISLYLLFKSQFLTNFAMSYQYIFLDESGNLDFTVNGSRNFVLTSVEMRRPFKVLRAIDDFKHDCLESGMEFEYFHCSQDNPKIRNKFFEIVSHYSSEIQISSHIVQKSGIDSKLQDDGLFIPELMRRLLKTVLLDETQAGLRKVIVITDTLPVKGRKKVVERTIQRLLSKEFPEKLKYQIMHHQSKSHYGLQVADYCCWAINRKFQRGQNTWFDMINPAIRNERYFAKFPE